MTRVELMQSIKARALEADRIVDSLGIPERRATWAK